MPIFVWKVKELEKRTRVGTYYFSVSGRFPHSVVTNFRAHIFDFPKRFVLVVIIGKSSRMFEITIRTLHLNTISTAGDQSDMNNDEFMRILFKKFQKVCNVKFSEMDSNTTWFRGKFCEMCCRLVRFLKKTPCRVLARILWDSIRSRRVYVETSRYPEGGKRTDENATPDLTDTGSKCVETDKKVTEIQRENVIVVRKRVSSTYEEFACFYQTSSFKRKHKPRHKLLELEKVQLTFFSYMVCR